MVSKAASLPLYPQHQSPLGSLYRNPNRLSLCPSDALPRAEIPRRRPQYRPLVVSAAVGTAGGPSTSAVAPQPTLYELLGLSPDDEATLADIKNAYRRMARKYHPDVCPRERRQESIQIFIEIQEAYETLSDPRSRAIYDRAVIHGLASAAPSGRKQWNLRPRDVSAEDQAHWKPRWEEQLRGLKFRKTPNSESWAAKVRNQR